MCLYLDINPNQQPFCFASYCSNIGSLTGGLFCFLHKTNSKFNAPLCPDGSIDPLWRLTIPEGQTYICAARHSDAPCSIMDGKQKEGIDFGSGPWKCNLVAKILSSVGRDSCSLAQIVSRWHAQYCNRRNDCHTPWGVSSSTSILRYYPFERRTNKTQHFTNTKTDFYPFHCEVR